MDAQRDDSLPDFTVYGRFGLTPRSAYYLWTTMRRELDMMSEAIDNGDFDCTYWLPPVAVRLHGQDEPWLRRLADAGWDLTRRLGEGKAIGDAFTHNMAQQVFLGWALRAAADRTADGTVPSPESVGVRLPQLDRDFEWTVIGDVLLPDADHEMLFNAAYDGVESGADELRSEMGIGDELHPDHWFDPYSWADLSSPQD